MRVLRIFLALALVLASGPIRAARAASEPRSGGSWTLAAQFRSSDQPAGRWGLAPDELRVSLSPGTGARFLEVVNLVMGTRTLKSLGHGSYAVRKGDQGDTDDYAAFFAALPYVLDVRPRPHRRPEEQIPAGKLLLGLGASGAETSGQSGNQPSSRSRYVPGELLVKFKHDVTPEQIADFDAAHSTTVKGTLKLGDETIYKLGIPEGVAVPDMVHVYSASDLVEYAEPNYTLGIPERPGTIPGRPSAGSPAPGSGAQAPGAALLLDTPELAGASIVVTYQPGVAAPVPGLVAMIYGIKDLEDEDDGSVRYSLPTGVNPLTAARLLKLCPYVLAAEPAS